MFSNRKDGRRESQALPMGVVSHRRYQCSQKERMEGVGHRRYRWQL